MSSENNNTENSLLRLELLAESLGKLSKCDGLVSPEEARFITDFFRSLDFPAATRRQLIGHFNQGKLSPLSFGQLVQKVKDNFPSSCYPEIFRLYFSVAIADNQLLEAEKQCLKEAERIFRLPNLLEQLLRDFQSDHRQEQSRPRDSYDDHDLKLAYARLDVPPSASDEEVKRAWRNKIKANHPDLWQGKGEPEDVLKLAAMETRRINDAYQLICQARKQS